MQGFEKKPTQNENTNNKTTVNKNEKVNKYKI